MSYVDDHLLPGERVVHRAHLHKIILVLPVITDTLLAVGAALAFLQRLPLVGVALLVLGLVPAIWAFVMYTASEFAVTDKRVIIKVGWIRRRTLETMLGKVEGIGVEQSIAGRLLNFGTITVTGTGGTTEAFADIAHPLEFRRQVQAQVSAAEEARIAAGFITGAPGSGAPREERECPYCAERILARAKVCKHCGRDVAPLPAS